MNGEVLRWSSTIYTLCGIINKKQLEAFFLVPCFEKA